MTLLMLKIEEEQEEYRKLMRLAEELCIEDFGKEGNEEMKMQVDDDAEKEVVGGVFKKETPCLEGVDEEEILKLKALCHVRTTRI